MTRKEMLLMQLAEECAEVAQRASKIARFGANEIQEGHDLVNAERLTREYIDVLTVYSALVKEGVLRPLNRQEDEKYAEDKMSKIEKYLEYSKSLGTLSEEVLVKVSKIEQVEQHETSQTQETKNL